MGDDDWRLVGARIQIVRARRWATRQEFAEVTGLSVRVLLDLELGSRQRYRPSTLAAVEKALAWEPGSIERIVQGGRPDTVYEPEMRRILDAWPYLSAETKSTLAMIAEQSRRI